MKKLRWTRSVLVALAMVSGLGLDLGRLTPKPFGQKPMFPVWTRLLAVNRPEPGGVVRVLATLTAWVPGEPLEWSLEVPEGLRHLSGPLAWTGLLSKGETVTFEIEIGVPDGQAYEIHARARVSDRPKVTGGASLRIDLGGYEGPRGTGRLVTGDGGTYLQYQGEVTGMEVER